MDLEYKVIHTQTPLFSDTARMHEILEQEARAGWQLLEKENNFRIKLHRNISHRENDKNLDFDAYRTSVGVSPVLAYGTTAVFTVGIVALILYLALGSQS